MDCFVREFSLWGNYIYALNIFIALSVRGLRPNALHGTWKNISSTYRQYVEDIFFQVLNPKIFKIVQGFKSISRRIYFVRDSVYTTLDIPECKVGKLLIACLKEVPLLES